MPSGLVEYLNIPAPIATVISAGKASLHELDTVYGVADLWMMLEVITVDNHNARIMNQPKE
ncbi:hypothetical protein [Yersinia massiliensis]|uniref:hypothetical protein n=1 Tax=Yersinia massiliensis TaxID=419257 RepID=UPI00031471EB|nr:hypothetical protein [Yersinia massiliensis]